MFRAKDVHLSLVFAAQTLRIFFDRILFVSVNRFILTRSDTESRRLALVLVMITVMGIGIPISYIRESASYSCSRGDHISRLAILLSSPASDLCDLASHFPDPFDTLSRVQMETITLQIALEVRFRVTIA
jgi:hypothetical protein